MPTTHYSGILVVTSPDRTDECVRSLDALRDIEVHHRQSETGRIIVVQESETLAAQEDRLLEIRRQPHVILAELVYHYRETNGNTDGQSVDSNATTGERRDG